MREKKNIQKAESIVVSPADFVLSWKDVSMFSQNYTLDRNVIGEGKFFHFDARHTPFGVEVEHHSPPSGVGECRIELRDAAYTREFGFLMLLPT